MSGSGVDQTLLSALQPPDRRGLHEVVLAQLLAAIRSGQLRPGDRLLEAEIAERLDLSRGIVREAIRKLEQEGLVVTHPHRGAFIARLTPQDAAEVFSMRRVLETFAVRLAVNRVDEQALEEMTETVRAMVAAAEQADRFARIRIDMRFHEQVCLASGHSLLSRFWNGLVLRLWLVHYDPRRSSWPGPVMVSRAEAHLELVDCLRRRDAEAAVAWMESHIDVIARKALDELNAAATSEGAPGSTPAT